MDHISSTVQGEELSILNIERKTLPGPEFLHDLICWSGTSVNAIDFWTASGDIYHISYKALDDQTSALADEIAAALIASGINREDVVIPVLIPQSPELYVSWIAILKAGAAFCPIAIDSPAERVKFILQDISPSLVLTNTWHEEWLADITPDIKILSVSQAYLHSISRSALSSITEVRAKRMARRPESLAYIMYTSGSTGVPKGVKISHKAVCQALLAHDEHLPLFNRFLQFASPTFDVSVFETFFPLFRGATLVGRHRESMLADLPGTIRNMNVDAAELTPTVAGTLLKNRKAAPCLRLLLTIGEMLFKPVIEEFGESRTRSGILYAMYGPTEASIHCTIAAKISKSSSIHNIGRPLATVTAVIIKSLAEHSSAEYNILPNGQIGELAVAGQLASGYLNRAEQTQAAFIDLPGYGTFYRTGDRAYIAKDGNLEMLGRISSGQVKLRGQRVELGEIESVACRASGVVTAAASIIGDALVLFCVQDGNQATVADIRTFCKQHLLSSMVPGDIVLIELESLPRLPSGKIDRKEIEREYVCHRNIEALDYALPMDEVTAKICNCISEELGLQITTTSSLWAEGLNSLIAIKVASALRVHGIELSVLNLLELETVADIVKFQAQHKKRKAPEHSTGAFIEDTEEWHDVQTAVKITLGDAVDVNKVEHILPCSAIQAAMIAETLSDAKLNFNIIELEADVNTTLDDVRTAFWRLAQKNEILRSGFVSIDHHSMPFVQVVWYELDHDQDMSLVFPLKITPAEGKRNRFTVQIHHAVYDGWSWDLIMDDLNSLLAKQQVLDRPQFRDVNRKQRRLRSSQRKTAEDYWRQILATASPFRLPQLNARLGIASELYFECGTLQTSSSDLVAFAMRLRVSPQTILSTAVSLVLGSYAGSSDVLFGLVSSGRHVAVPEIDQVIGPCLSTLPLRINLSTVQTIQDMLLYVHGLQMGHLEHGGLGLRDVLATAGMSDQQKIFDTIFVWQESLPGYEQNPKLIEVIKTRDSLDYTLIIEATPSEGEITVKLSYDVAKISPEQATVFLVQINHLVAEIVASDGKSLRDIWDNCNSSTLALTNAKPRVCDISFGLTSTIQDIAKRHPDQLAVSLTHDFDPATGAVNSEKLTYSTLWDRANQMAQVLQDLGLELDEIVCVLVDKSLDLYVLNLAIVLAGGAFLNVDTRTPSGRIYEVLGQVKCKLVIIGNDYISRTVPNSAEQVLISLSNIKERASKCQGQRLDSQVNVNGSNLAYAVMTSGTSGVPKAILVTRENLLSNIDILSKTYPRFDDQDTLLQACSPAFDVFVFELFWTWHMGMCLCSSANDVLFRDIEGFIRATKVSHLSLTPSVAALIHPDNVPSVMFLVTAGEPMNSKVFASWAGRGLYQGYGPAETTNICNVRGPVRRDDLINNVGAPFPNTSIFICAKQRDGNPDFDVRILPIGAVGEIVIGGDQVAQGYADKSLTAKSFITTRYGRLYRSGDIGRLLANGDLVVLGREDDQVKLRGQRIELGDINTAITRATFVKDVVTLIIDKNNATAQMVSFWTPRQEQRSPDAGLELYELLEASLPHYMIPESLIPIDAIPLTRQGKVDKDALVQHFMDLDTADLQQFGRGAAEFEAQGSLTDEEKQISEIVSEITKTPLANIRPSTSFYSLGLDSISSVRLSQRLRQANLGRVDVSLILKHCSVRRLCKALVDLNPVSTTRSDSGRLEEVFQLKWRNKITQMAESEGKFVEKIISCTALQESILASQANKPDSSTYAARMEFEVHGNVEKLRVAWSHLVKRHQILRTGFIITPFVDHAYAQIVFKEFDLPWFTSAEESSTNHIGSSFSIYPQWRLIMDNPRPDKSTSLTLVMSHALYDFQALALLLREVEMDYQSMILLPVVSPDAYTRYILNMSMTEIDVFWRGQLEGHQPQSFVGLFQTDEIHDQNQRTYTHTSIVSRQRLQAASEKYEFTTSTLYLAAWVRLLSCYMKNEDVVFGNVFSGRNLPIEGVASIVAPLFNTLPLRVRMTGRKSIRELFAKIQEAMLGVVPFQPSPLRRIMRHQKHGAKYLFDTLVLVQSGGLNLEESIWTLREEQGDMDFAGVIIEMVPDARKDQLEIKLHVRSKDIDSSTAAQILRNYDVLLDEAVQYPHAQSNNFASIVSDLPDFNPVSVTSSNSPFAESTQDDNPKQALTDLGLSIRRLFAQFSTINASKIQKSTSIFELGLDSLHVVQIASELRLLGYNVTGADVLEARTVDRLSQACHSRAGQDILSNTNTFDLEGFEHRHRAGVCEQLGIMNEEVQAVRPCTSTQSGILTEFINSYGKLYFNSTVLELSAIADVALVKKSWQTVMNRNDMLRTGFVMLNTSEHTYGMVTFAKGTRDLPWIIEEDADEAEAKKLAKGCLQRIHDPCWRLLLRNLSGSTRLEVHFLHALYDANSLDGLLSEVATVYHQDWSLPDPFPIAPALRTILDQEEASRKSSGEFWTRLGVGTQPSRFPDLNIRQSAKRDSMTITKSSDSLLPELEIGCRRLGVTLQSVCHTAWARLLSAYTGESKVTFGVVLSGRTLPETADALFPTINTAPFSIEVRRSTSEMLEEATEINVGLYKHQFTPLTAMKEWFPSEGELYDTIVVLQTARSTQGDDRPWKVVGDRAFAEYAISLEVLSHIDDDLEIRITTRQDVVPAEHAAIILQQYEVLLRQIVRESSFTQFMPESLRSVVAAKDFNISSSFRLLHDFVEATNAETPEAIALEFAYNIADGRVEKRCWTYRQLSEESNRIAHLILAFGARQGDFVAVCFDKCPEASFAILAVLKVGCAYVAIDPGAPVARKRFILDDAKCKILLTTKNLTFSPEKGSNLSTLAVDDDDLIQVYHKKNPVLEWELRPSDTCYCLYTSGTTGQPKGCLITHASAVQAMLSFRRIFAGHWDSNSRFLQFASFHFDVSVLEQYWSWSVGITVTSAPRDVLFEDIPGAIDALQITHLDLTPSLARLLNPEEVPSLCGGVFIVGGEQVTQDIIDTWGPHGCLYNFYGPSEVTIGCTVHKRVKKGVKATNIGRPWDNVGAFVLEPGSEIAVIRGAVGELCLSGPLVGKGYLNRPGLTAEKFIILKEYDVRVYRSGDLVRLLHDDSFEFLGRIDDQIKLRGQRLEVREIDHSLKQASESIADVATVVMKHADQPSEQLVAFFTIRGEVTRSLKITALTSSDAQFVVSRVRRYLQDVLPAYMVPTHFLPISHIPLSANNKADLAALKAFFVAMPVRSLRNMDWNGRSIVFMTETTRKLINLLAEFLGVPESAICPSSRLFELGLDSISAVGFASILRKEGLKGADAATIMRRPVVADLANELAASDGDDYKNVVEVAKHNIDRFRKTHEQEISSLAGVESFWPCTPLQEDMLSKTIYRGDTSYYLSAFHYVLESSVSLDMVKNAWVRAQRNFPILRTTFMEVSGKQYAQVVRQSCIAPVHHLVLAPEQDAMNALAQSASQWSNKADVLCNEPCWEVEVVETSEGQLYMSLRIFHGLYDANSLSLMLDDVVASMRNSNAASGIRDPDFHQALPYGPLCHRTGAQAFWKRRFSPPLLLNLSPIYEGSKKSSTTFSVDHALPEGFAETRNKFAVAESALFQAAFLSSLHSKFSIFPTFGMVISGRSFPLTGVEEIRGPLFNTLPVQIVPKLNWSRADLIKACHNFNVDSKPFEHTSLKEVRQWAEIDAGKALFDTLFVFQKNRKGSVDRSKELWKEIGQTMVPDYPLNVEVELKKGIFKLTIVADSEFLSEGELQSLASNFLSSVEQLVERPDELLLPEDANTLASPQERPFKRVPYQRIVSHSVLQEVKSQVASLAQQDVTDLADDANLFGLGLDSISMITLSGALKRRNLPVSVNIIMQLSTPTDIAKYLTERQHRSVSASNPEDGGQELLETAQAKLRSALHTQDVDLDHVEQVLPVTPMQEGVLANFEKYYHFALLELCENTDFDRLCLAWNAAIALHPTLRTNFVAIDDPATEHVFAQLIFAPQDHQWTIKIVHDDSQLRGLIARENSKMLKAGLGYPSIVIKFITNTDSNNRYVLLGMSHAIYDGWSIQLLHLDIFDLYNEYQVRRPPIHPYIQYIMNRLRGGESRFWTEQMSDYTPRMFPSLRRDRADRPIPQKLTIESRTTSSIIRQFCMDHSITVQTLGLTIWNVVLASYLHRRDVCFGVVLACRDSEDADQLMFPTFNTVPFRPRFTGGSHLDLLKHIHRLSLQIAEHQNFPLRDIKKLQSQLSGGYSELFDTLFVLQKRPNQDDALPKLYKEVDLGEDPNLEYPVNVEMELGEKLMWTVAVSGGILGKEGLNELITRLEETLESILQDPARATMSFKEPERAPKEPATTTDTELAEPQNQQPNAKDANLRNTIFDTLASVARCSVGSLSGDTNIYSIGLDSINMIKVTGLLRKKGIALPVSTMIAAVTLDRIVREADYVTVGEHSLTSGQIPICIESASKEYMQSHFFAQRIATTAIEAVLPASAGQIFMLDFYKASSRSLFYPTFRYRISNGKISEDQVLRAWDAVMQLFPALRNRFVEKDGRFWQVVMRSDALKNYPPAAHLSVSKDSQGFIVELRLHHTLYDAVSLPIVISAFEEEGKGTEFHTNARESALQSFIEATRGSATTEARRVFWTGYLIQGDLGIPPSSGTFEARRVEVVQEKAITDSGPLLSKAAAAGVSLQALFLAIFGRIYAGNLPEQDSVVLGIYLANRGLDIEGLGELAAPIVNIVPVIVDVRADLHESAKIIQEDLAIVQRAEYCGVTLQEIYEWTGVRVDCFVNFVPRVENSGDENMYGDADGDGDGEGDGGKIRLVPYPHGSREEAMGQGQELLTSPFLGLEPTRELPWCVPSIDIEAKLEVGGSLTMGLFAPEDKLSEEGARRMLEDLKKMLMSLK